MKLPLVNIIFEEGFPIYLDCEQSEVVACFKHNSR